MTYQPSEKTAALLNWMLAKIQSVPYGVTFRWVFYQAVQERGLLKSDYRKIKPYVAAARKNFWNGWAPTTLVDDTREIFMSGGGYTDFADWLSVQKDKKPVYAVYPRQDHIVQVWFEAEAMLRQFQYYVSPYRIALVPFRGDTSIPHKWQIAEYLADLYQAYRKPIHILYFGDYEPFKDRGSRAKGLTIPIDALKDIRPWLGALLLQRLEEAPEGSLADLLQFHRVGLNKEQVAAWHLPENPQRLGEYQWEALSDPRARELILGSIEAYWDKDTVLAVEAEELVDAEEWQKMLQSAIERRDAE